MLKKPDHMAAISAALTDAAGVESRFEPVVQTAGKSQSAEDGEASLLSALGATFDKANVIVQE